MSLRKEITLFKIFARIGLMDRMENPIGFSFVMIGTIVRIVVSLVYFKALYGQVNQIGGWQYGQVIILQGVFFFIEAIAWMSYTRGFSYLPRLVENGDLDMLLIKPINLRAFFIYRRAELFFSAPQAIVGLGLVWYGIDKTINFWVVLPQFLIYLASAFVIHYSVVVILFSVNFFHVLPQAAYLLGEVSKLGQYPREIYRGMARLLLSIIVPLAFIYSVPAESLFSEKVSRNIILAPMLAVAFYVLGKKIWSLGIARYESANG